MRGTVPGSRVAHSIEGAKGLVGMCRLSVSGPLRRRSSMGRAAWKISHGGLALAALKKAASSPSALFFRDSKVARCGLYQDQ